MKRHKRNKMKKVAVFLFALFLCASVFAGKKSDKKVMILMMDCDASGELTRLLEEMTENNREYAMEGVCQNFVTLLYRDRLKKYQAKNVWGLFPNHWESPLYRKDKQGMEDIAIECARNFIRKNLPGVDAEHTEIIVDTFPGRPYAGIFFEY